MPLSEKARIEVYIPDLPLAAYYGLLETLEADFTYNFGGCTLQRGLDGNYLSEAGEPVQDRVPLLFTDTPYSFSENRSLLSNFADELRALTAEALEEEAVLVLLFLCITSSSIVTKTGRVSADGTCFCFAVRRFLRLDKTWRFYYNAFVS